MSKNSSPLTIKLLCISLLFVSSSAHLFEGLPFFLRRVHHDLRHIGNNGEDDGQQNEQHGPPHFGPGLGGHIPGLPGFGKPGFGKAGIIGPGMGDNNDENQEQPPAFPKEKEKEKDDEEQGGTKKKQKKPKDKKKNKKDLPGDQQEDNDQNEQPNLPEQGDNNQNEQPNMPIQGAGQQPNVPVQQGQAAEMVETNYQGKWEVVSPNSGVSAMHLQLLPTNRLAMFDASNLGKSSIELPPNRCRLVPNTTNEFDCFAHSVEYDLQTNSVRTLKVETNPWCSSGGLSPEGTLVNTGGWAEGERSLRYYKSCDLCDWKETNIKLQDMRWYSTQTMIADGRFVLLGGRRAFNYELLTPNGDPIPGRIDLPFLFETTDLFENNLYPFVHLAPDGNLFILANNRAILLDVKANKIVRKYPDLPGGARNYPGSASSAIIPINLNNDGKLDIEVLVCGGGQPDAFGKAEKEKIFLPALDTCGRIQVLNPTSNWEMEKMPAPRVMSDMLILPNGEILILNGAQKGASGWQFADEPILTPFLYSPYKPNGQRFKVMAPSQIPRMYHSSSAVLPDGKILVAGSNTNPGYLFQNVKFPTELRVEKFSPPYLDPALQQYMPKIVNLANDAVGYGQNIQFTCNIAAPGEIQKLDVMVTMYRPPFTTHGYSMDQRLLNLKISSLVVQGVGNYQLQVQAPATGELAPPGYYLLFANYRGVPSPASWIKLH